MSLLIIDQQALDREVQYLYDMYKRDDPRDLAADLGFEHNQTKESGCWHHSYKRGTAHVWGLYHNKQVTGWVCAQKGERGFVAHIFHSKLDAALADAINREC